MTMILIVRYSVRSAARIKKKERGKELSIKERFAKLKTRWQAARKPGQYLRPLDADDRETLTFLINCAGEVLRDGQISQEEGELLREAWGDWREARGNTK